MKRKLFALAASIWLVPAVLCAAAFEGRVNFKMSSGRDQPQEIRYALKSGKIRMEIPGDRGAMLATMIVDPVKRETIMIMDEQRMYMTMAMPADDEQPGAGKMVDDVKLEKTGETERILGYTAEKYIATHRDTKTEMWLAEGIGAFAGPGSSSAATPGGRRGSGAPAPQAWERAVAGKGLFPLRVISRDKAGKDTFRMEATRIDKQALPDALFAPPADYEKFDMGAMMQGAGGLPGMMRKKG